MKNINKSVLDAAFKMAKDCRVKRVFIFFDAIGDFKLQDTAVKDFKITLVTQRDLAEVEKATSELKVESFVHLPKIEMTRISRIKIAVMLALSKKIIKLGEKIIFINGIPDSEVLDNIVILDTEKESEIITTHGVNNISDDVKPEIFQEILNFSIELSSRGREGKPIGTIFVLGDEEKVMQLSKQMIINPFKGYSDDERNILNPDIRETLREFSAIDGAFIITGDGKVLTAGRYLGAASDDASIPRGLGARHIAAAGITSLTKAVAIVISESTGDVRIFKNGKVLIQIENPETPPREGEGKPLKTDFGRRK